MEDLWAVQRSGIDIEDVADMAEYKRFLKRFSDEEERQNRKQLLYCEPEDNLKDQGDKY